QTIIKDFSTRSPSFSPRSIRVSDNNTPIQTHITTSFSTPLQHELHDTSTQPEGSDRTKPHRDDISSISTSVGGDNPHPSTISLRRSIFTSPLTKEDIVAHPPASSPPKNSTLRKNFVSKNASSGVIRDSDSSLPPRPKIEQGMSPSVSTPIRNAMMMTHSDSFRGYSSSGKDRQRRENRLKKAANIDMFSKPTQQHSLSFSSQSSDVVAGTMGVGNAIPHTAIETEKKPTGTSLSHRPSSNPPQTIKSGTESGQLGHMASTFTGLTGMSASIPAPLQKKEVNSAVSMLSASVANFDEKAGAAIHRKEVKQRLEQRKRLEKEERERIRLKQREKEENERKAAEEERRRVHESLISGIEKTSESSPTCHTKIDTSVEGYHKRTLDSEVDVEWKETHPRSSVSTIVEKSTESDNNNPLNAQDAQEDHEKSLHSTPMASSPTLGWDAPSPSPFVNIQSKKESGLPMSEGSRGSSVSMNASSSSFIHSTRAEKLSQLQQGIPSRTYNIQRSARLSSTQSFSSPKVTKPNKTVSSSTCSSSSSPADSTQSPSLGVEMLSSSLKPDFFPSHPSPKVSVGNAVRGRQRALEGTISGMQAKQTVEKLIKSKEKSGIFGFMPTESLDLETYSSSKPIISTHITNSQAFISASSLPPSPSPRPPKPSLGTNSGLDSKTSHCSKVKSSIKSPPPSPASNTRERAVFLSTSFHE
ncbi:hypothetical protein ADUPG1_011715, partial [Aduncisulcus paluster]